MELNIQMKNVVALNCIFLHIQNKKGRNLFSGKDLAIISLEVEYCLIQRDKSIRLTPYSLHRVLVFYRCDKELQEFF